MHLASRLPNDVFITEVWHKDAPLGITQHVISGHAARIHKGPPAARLNTGRTVIFR